MRFESPWILLVLLVIPLLFWLRARKARTGSLTFSSTDGATRSGRSLRQRMLWLPFTLRALAITLLTVALARPQQGMERIREVSKGIAIEMVVDRSGSMKTEMEHEGKAQSRLDVVKKVFGEFVAGNRRDLAGRPNDLIGMVAFARYPDTVCPLTLAHGALIHFLESVQTVKQRQEDGTAIGEAVALAAARLKTAEREIARQNIGSDRKYEIKSKIIILLTDGENNAGRRSPLQAAQLAAKWGIKIYTIRVGGGEAFMSVNTMFGAMKMPMASPPDDGTLAAMAKESGGMYRRADDAQALHAVYKEIDHLERSEFDADRYMDYREKFGVFALAGLILLILEIALNCTVFRRIP